ncbi:hypothetical protein [Fuerstiella marisgermanici]|uniref:hypothetical protein n=1 Tax=Fuerstiella marisgermanici TaxID=1891926 RepID=UPI0013147AEF|nr:hypothetical protein [Fuerstiella marisgermanici]
MKGKKKKPAGPEDMETQTTPAKANAGEIKKPSVAEITIASNLNRDSTRYAPGE